MSHDDRIRQLTDVFIADLHVPIEASLRQILGQMLMLATQDQAAAIEQALQSAAAEQQAAVEDARQAAGLQHEQALASLRAELGQQHEQAFATLRGELGQQYEEALNGIRADLAERHAAEFEGLRAELARQYEEALNTARGELADHHAAELEALRAELGRQREEVLLEMARQEAAERDEAVQAAVQAVRDDLAREHEAALASVREEAAARHEAALAAAREEAVAERDAAVQAARDEMTREHESALLAVHEQAASDRDAGIVAAREALGGDHEAALSALRAQLAAEHEAELAQLREQLGRDRDAALLETRLAAEAASADALSAALHERDTARASAAELTDQLAEARAQHQHLAQLADAAAESSSAQQQTTHAQVEERQSELACSERLVSAVRSLDAARTLTEVLAILADHVASEHLRCAVLLVHGARLRGWRVAGMGDLQAGALDLPVNAAGILGRAVETGLPISSSETTVPVDEAVPSLLVPPPGRAGLALPIVVGGRTVAVLYADDGSAAVPTVPSDWPETAEIVARHAGRCLEALTLARANTVGPRPAPDARPTPDGRPATRPAHAPAPIAVENDEAQEEESARRHARLLISEIKLYNESLVEQGRRERNLVLLLGPEIERARRLYEEKIPAAVRERVNCFDEEIVRTLAGGDRTLLGQIT